MKRDGIMMCSQQEKDLSPFLPSLASDGYSGERDVPSLKERQMQHHHLARGGV